MSSRCASRHGVYRCVRAEEHGGAHVAPLSGNRAMRWGMHGIGCCDPDCVRKPDHPSPHRNGRGVSWWPIDADEDDEALGGSVNPQ